MMSLIWITIGAYLLIGAMLAFYEWRFRIGESDPWEYVRLALFWPAVFREE